MPTAQRAADTTGPWNRGVNRAPKWGEEQRSAPGEATGLETGSPLGSAGPPAAAGNRKPRIGLCYTSSRQPQLHAGEPAVRSSLPRLRISSSTRS